MIVRRQKSHKLVHLIKETLTLVCLIIWAFIGVGLIKLAVDYVR